MRDRTTGNASTHRAEDAMMDRMPREAADDHALDAASGFRRGRSREKGASTQSRNDQSTHVDVLNGNALEGGVPDGPRQLDRWANRLRQERGRFAETLIRYAVFVPWRGPESATDAGHQRPRGRKSPHLTSGEKFGFEGQWTT